MGNLYVVATPIGNLEDITLRALRVLGEASLIAAEDTRTTRGLLAHYGIKTRSISYNDHNKRARIPLLLDALTKGDVALVSEAGMPTISDPGLDLVVAAIEAGHQAVSIPGPSAITAALAVSGLSSRQFVYVGFLPRRGKERRSLLADLAQERRTIILFEAPHRLQKTLTDLLEVLGDRRIAVCRELTKLHEEIFRGPLSAAIDHFREPRGEFTLVIEGGSPESPEAGEEEDAEEEMRRLHAQGATAKQAVAAIVGRYGLSRRQAYRLWLESR